MKTSKFSEAQIAYILRQAEDGTAIGEVCRSAGISEATFYIYGLFSLCKAESGGA
jgi:putative transposase